MNPLRTETQSVDGIRLLDTHCHLNRQPLLSLLPEVLETARRAGGAGCVLPGVHPLRPQVCRGYGRRVRRRRHGMRIGEPKRHRCL